MPKQAFLSIDDGPAVAGIGGLWVLRFDGSCHSNGQPDATGRWAFSLQDAGGKVALEMSGPTVAPLVTNNVSEWQGLLNGLKRAASLLTHPAELRIEGDSQLVINCLTYRWGSNKPHLTVYRDECRRLLGEMGVRWEARWIPREQNTRCDRLAAPLSR